MKAYLFKYDLPVKKFASDLGISTSYLYQLLKKERKPSLELALRIELYTNGEVTAKELIEGKGKFTPQNPIVEKLKHLEKHLNRIEERLSTLEASLLNHSAFSR
ncbi:MAG: helix-turn-helix domain-containing protein [Simkania sp.]|nr:helix-turn-helix domain-containing protein [Simkania sp.]MCB1082766.1 helix-turn-helix domain-containing protein [Simkania sp.]